MAKRPKLDLRDYELVIDIRDWLDDVGIKYKTNGTGQLIVRQCFNCGAKEKLYIDAKKGVYNCFKCGPKDDRGKGNIVKFATNATNMSYKDALKKFYNIGDQVLSATMKDLMDSTGNDLTKKRKEAEIYLPEPLRLNPKEFEPLDKLKHPEAWNYLLNRGLDDFSISKLGAYYWERDFEIEVEENGKDVKIPIRDKRVANMVRLNGQIIGYVGRDITGKIPKAYKVMNSVGKFRSHSIWNMDQAKNSEELVICEGIFSAVKCGILRSVALLGKTATPQQIDLIIKANPKKIYICLDVGTEVEQDTIFDNLVLSFPNKVYQIKMPEIMSFKNEIPDSYIDKINQIFKVKFTKTSNSKELIIPQAMRKKLKLLISSKKGSFSKEESEIYDLAYQIAEKMEYKDAGDYTFEEMNSFIKEAKPYKKGSLLSL